MTQTASPTGDSPYSRENWHYWERDDDGNPIPPDRQSPDGEESPTTSNPDGPSQRERWVATAWLKETADLLCPIELHEPPCAPSVSAAVASETAPRETVLDAHEVAELTGALFEAASDEPMGERDRYALHSENGDVELTEPQAFAPMDSKARAAGDSRGVDRAFRVNEASGYLPRGPIIANRPADEFLKLVFGYLIHAIHNHETALRPSTAEQIYAIAERMKRCENGPHDVTIMEEVVRLVDDPTVLDED